MVAAAPAKAIKSVLDISYSYYCIINTIQESCARSKGKSEVYGWVVFSALPITAFSPSFGALRRGS
jgi:hypothetical protein